MPRPVLLAALSLLVLSSLSCSPGVQEVPEGGPDADSSAGCDEPCGEGLVCDQGRCLSASDRCLGVSCPEGYRCYLGACILADACEGVFCTNPGEVCELGRCVSGQDDTDGDGFSADEDCDDSDGSIYPGATERCNGVDDDCDGALDEGFDGDGDGFTECGYGDPEQADCDDGDAEIHPGAAERCDEVDDDCDGDVDEDIPERGCATSCGEGTERCEEGGWVCSAPTSCDCGPAGTTDRQLCGLCGTRTRTCQGDLTWGSFSACTGEGECSPGETRSEVCEACGTRTQSCTEACTWGSFGACLGEGECSPGETQAGSCDRCSQQVCSPFCSWGGCELKPTSACEYRGGANWRCCDVGSWQFCLSSCVWSTDCATCTSCGC